MNSEQIKLDTINEHLESFLERLYLEINSSVSEKISDLEHPKQLDRYLHEVNSFYFRSFHDNFFPYYLASIQELVTQLLKVSHQEETLYHDIIANLKRYAQLYNQVKKVAALLKRSRDETNKELLVVIRDQDHHAVELLYTLKKMRDGLNSLQAVSHYLSELEQDKKLRDLLLGSPPVDHAVINFVTTLDFNNPDNSLACNRLLLHLEYQRKVLARMESKEQDFQALAESNLNEIQEKQRQLPSDRSIKPILELYERNMQHSIMLYTEWLAQCISGADHEHTQQVARDFSIWLDQSLTLIDRILLYVPGQQDCILSYVNTLPELEPAALSTLDHKVLELIDSLEKTILSLSEASEPDFAYFNQATQSLLDSVLPVITAAMANPALFAIVPIASRLQRVELDVMFAQDQLQLLNEKHKHARGVQDKLVQIINMLDGYQSLLANIRSDLERLLNPRNLARAWKDVHIRVERIPLEVGREFPSAYLELLDRYQVETRIAPNIKKDHLILLEEGDLFIIKVENQVVEELPYLVIAQKG